MGIDDCVNIKIDHILHIDKWKISKKISSFVAVRIAVIDLIYNKSDIIFLCF